MVVAVVKQNVLSIGAGLSRFLLATTSGPRGPFVRRRPSLARIVAWAVLLALAGTRDALAVGGEARPAEAWFLYALFALVPVVVAGIVWRFLARRAVRRETELRREVESRTVELARLSQLTEAINEAVTVEEVLEHLYENLRSIVPYDRIGLALLDEDQIVLKAVWSRGKVEPVGIARGYEAPLAGSSLENVLASGKPRIIPDLEKHLADHPESNSTRKILSEGVRSNLTCPLRAMGRPVGFVFFSSFEPGTYNEGHAEFLQKIAGHLSLIVEKSKLYEDLLETKKRLETANLELERLAAVDGLTGLANRRTFDERLEAEWRRSQRSNEPVTLLMVDVDEFKAFNDEHGHQAGDECLKAIATCLAENARRAGDLVARYGGEEFGVILPQCDSPEGLSLAETLRRSVEALGIEHGVSKVSPYVTISIGLASVFPVVGESIREFVERADRALYEAKRRGRNRVVASEPVATTEV